MANIILATKDLKAGYVLQTYRDRKLIVAVNEVEIEVHSREIYGIAGESGSGKTTLLKTIFADTEPPLTVFGGKTYYYLQNGPVDVFLFSEEERRRTRWTYISYIPQGSMSVFNPVRKIKATFLDFLESHVDEGEKEKLLSLAYNHLKDLGLPLHVLEAYPHQLSGGMRQRVAIALATLLEPKIILADEPTTALDVVAQRAVLGLLLDIQRSLKNTIVLVTHDMGVHAQVSNRLAIMYAGRIVEEGETKELFAHPLHPYTRYLIQSLPRIGDKSPRLGVPGSPPLLLSPPLGCAFHPRCPLAQKKCQEEIPPLLPFPPTHRVACFFAKEE